MRSAWMRTVETWRPVRDTEETARDRRTEAASFASAPAAEPLDRCHAYKFAFFSFGFSKVVRAACCGHGECSAARFDLMFVLLRRDTVWAGGATRQSDLRRTLGVTASVVSRMLRSLEALGWVQRTRSGYDRRQREVTLTEPGRERIHTAYKTLLRAAQRLVSQAICFGQHRNRDARFRHVATLEQYLAGIRRHFGDIASLYYPWGHPDD